jgi:hypothetical protein
MQILSQLEIKTIPCTPRVLLLFLSTLTAHTLRSLTLTDITEIVQQKYTNNTSKRFYVLFIRLGNVLMTLHSLQH